MSNDHYVPQHYLRAWALDNDKNKVHAYKPIPHVGGIKFTKVSIEYTSSEQDLYSITDSKKRAEFETIIMTEKVDTPGSIVLKKLRAEPLAKLTPDEKKQLTKYIIAMEARNPLTIKAMKFTEQDVKNIAKKTKKQFPSFKKSSVDDVEQFNLSIIGSLGNAAAGMIAGNDQKDWMNALLGKEWIEIHRSDTQGFLCSDYPVGRYQDYLSPALSLTFPISPTKAIWMPSHDISQNYLGLDEVEKAEIRAGICKSIDFYTLGRATTVYSKGSSDDSFVRKHIGWALNNDWRNYEQLWKKTMGEGNATWPY